MTAIPLIVLAALIGAQVPGPQDQSGRAEAPASIAGRVLDAATGQPLARALVRVQPVGPSSGGPRKAVQAVTDGDGRFAVAPVAPGRYELLASAGEFNATYVRDARGASTAVLLKPGEKRELSVILRRALAISGRVLDESGRPLAQVRMALRNLETGSPSHGYRMMDTDDLGAFRIFGLEPGRYAVCAEGQTFPSFGPTAGPRHPRLVRTCFPSARDEASATPVVLREGEIDGLEIRMVRSHTATLRGVIVSADGSAPDSYLLSLERIVRNGTSSTSDHVRGSAFTISNVVPGRYRVSAQVTASPSAAQVLEMGTSHTIDVDGSDIDGLVITMKTSVSVRGVVSFEGGAPPAPAGRPLSIQARAHEHMRWSDPVEVGPDMTFELRDLFGANTLSLSGLPQGYVVRSVRYRGRDILDVPAEFDGDPRNAVEFIVTRHVAELSGRVIDERGEPRPGAAVYLFPADAARWQVPSMSGWRSSATAQYRVRNLAPGDYLVVAINEEDQKTIMIADWSRPNPYERLASLAERVTLLDNDRRVMDLRLTPIPQEWKR